MLCNGLRVQSFEGYPRCQGVCIKCNLRSWYYSIKHTRCPTIKTPGSRLERMLTKKKLISNYEFDINNVCIQELSEQEIKNSNKIPTIICNQFEIEQIKFVSVFRKNVFYLVPKYNLEIFYPPQEDLSLDKKEIYESSYIIDVIVRYKNIYHKNTEILFMNHHKQEEIIL